jgi:TPP-dependent pyruvate/acetoin dehydrogenase alpha subunit
MTEKGMSSEQAAAETINLARAAGATGYALSLFANKYLPGAGAMERVFAGERTGAGRLVGAGLGALKEIPGENIEEVGGKIAQNIAARQAGMNRDLMAGTGETAAIATVGAGGMGGVTGLIGGGKSAEQVSAEQTALAEKINKKNKKIYVLISDGELNEGTTWESLLFASFHKLDNLIIIIDYNKIQSLDYTKNILKLEPIDKKLISFGCKVIIINGHSFSQLYKSLSFNNKNKPLIIICDTIKGKGISFM